MARNKFDIDETLEKDAEFKLSNLTRMGKYLKTYKNKLLSTLALVIFSSVLGALSPYFFKIAIDDYIPNKKLVSVIVISIILLVTQIVNTFILKYKIFSMSQVGQGIIRDLRKDIFMTLQKLPFSYYDSRPHGKILVRVVNYVNSLSDMFSNGIINLITDFFSIFIVLAFMLRTNVQLTLVSLAGLPVLAIAVNIIKIKQRKAWRANSSKQANMNAYIHESIAGVKVTQSFVREKTNKSIFEEVTQAVKKTWFQAVRIVFLGWPAVDNISTLTTSFIYICAAYWITGEKIEIGVLVAMTAYAGRFWGPISNMSNIYNSIIVNMTYLERIFETIDEPIDVDDTENATELPTISGKVEFDNVTFGYDVGVEILKNISFTVKKGESIALVGPTGAGKTTVVNLISRFYNINSGKILLDGVDISGVTLKSLRSQMGIMLQDSFIFSGDIMENIRYGKLDATDEEVINASKAVMAHDFISQLEDGYHTEVNERGSRLSVGQRQLISFARALLADPKILILDEATSSIDTKTEKDLQEGLDRLLQNRTSFIIAHRLSTIKNADRIMYIDKGNVVESGTHDELIAKKGFYSSLYDAQYKFLQMI